MADWYVQCGIEAEGPFTRRDLRELATQGKISPQDQIRDGRHGTGIAAREVPGLLPTLKQASEPVRSRARQSAEQVNDLNLQSSPLLTIEQKEWIVIICGSVFMGSLLLIPLIQAFLNLFPGP